MKTTELSKEEKGYRIRRWVNIIAIILVIVGATLFFIFNGKYVVSFKNDTANSSFQIKGHDSSFIFNVKYQDIEGVYYYDEFSFGEEINKNSKRGLTWGEFKNEELGEYKLIALDKVTSYIALLDNSNSKYVFNYSSKEETKSLYVSIVEFLNKQNVTFTSEER